MSMQEEFLNALSQGDMSAATELFMTNDISPDLEVDGTTALAIALGNQAHDLARAMIKEGVDVTRSVGGRRPIHAVTDVAGVELLGSQGADLNAGMMTSKGSFSKGMTLLHIAALRGDQDLAGALLKHGAEINVSSADGRTPLHVAAERHKDMAKFLIERGADLDLKSKKKGTPRDILSAKWPEVLTESAHVRENGGTQAAAHGQADATKSTAQVEALQAPPSAQAHAGDEENTISPADPADHATAPIEGHATAEAPVMSAEQAEVAADEEENERHVMQPPAPAEENTITSATTVQRETTEVDGIEPNVPKQAAAPKPNPSLAAGSVLNGKFIRNEKGEYRRIGEERVALVDEGARIRFVDKQMDAFQAGIELAKLKEWNSIRVTGTEKFRAEAWYFARMQGLDVVGYEPNEKDMARLKGSQQRQAAGRAPDLPDQHGESLAEARDAALKAGYGVVAVDATRGRYTGKVVHESRDHFVQEVGRGKAVIHNVMEFKHIVNVKPGFPTQVQYRNGQGEQIDAGKNKGQSRSAER